MQILPDRTWNHSAGWLGLTRSVVVASHSLRLDVSGKRRLHHELEDPSST